MGVTILQPWFPEGKGGITAIDHLTKRLISMGAKQQGSFIVDCETIISLAPTMQQPSINKAVHLLHNSEFPASTFAILDTGVKHIPLVADNLFDLLMIKIGNVYTQKKQPNIESKGPRFEYGDFLIKLGSVTMNGNFKGILIEFEYRPCIVFINCWELMRELIQGFLGIPIPSAIPPFFQQQTLVAGHQSLKQNDSYQAIDTINQYLEHFINYRKQTTAIGGSMQMTGLPLRS